jgi:hypothetical protein
MKKSQILVMLLLTALVWAGCGGPIETLEFKSPAGDRSVTIRGKRISPAAPITLKVTLKSPKLSKDFEYEHPAGSLTNENCKAEWVHEAQVNITFTMSDGETWVLECYLLDDRLETLKRFKMDGRSIF